MTELVLVLAHVVLSAALVGAGAAVVWALSRPWVREKPSHRRPAGDSPDAAELRRRLEALERLHGTGRR